MCGKTLKIGIGLGMRKRLKIYRPKRMLLEWFFA